MDDTTGITVTGRGEATYAPDAMVVTVGVSVLRPTMTAARTEAATTTERILTALRAGGVQDRHVRTDQLSVQPEWDHRGPRPRRTGFRVTTTLQVRIEDIERAAGLLDRGVDAGGDDAVLQDVRFVLDPSPGRQAELRELAWREARTKAEHLAELAGADLGDVLDIIELSGHDPAGPGPRPMMRMAAAEAMPPIAEGELALSLALRVRFEIV